MINKEWQHCRVDARGASDGRERRDAAGRMEILEGERGGSVPCYRGELHSEAMREGQKPALLGSIRATVQLAVHVPQYFPAS